MPKSLRKSKGQFFTSLETARFMAGMFDLSLAPEIIRILDPGAGSGMLSAALVERLNEFGSAKNIHLTC
ncbi:MAG: SAM-dependent DNA methyltransferase, partial [Victivallales bacterium]|nr:SAM-dependent DNA methyltransferase [Victivallales bacterium]